MKVYCIKLAEEMLGVEKLDRDYERPLMKMEELANKCGGTIRSRQIVAQTIVLCGLLMDTEDSLK